MNARNRIIVALDVSDVGRATQLVRELEPFVGGFKLGLEFITSTYAQLVTLPSKRDVNRLLSQLQNLFAAVGGKLMYDGKFADIPNTVGGATKGLLPLSPKFFTVHASAGRAAMEAAVTNSGGSGVLGITVLTSIKSDECLIIFGEEPGTKVLSFAEMLAEVGATGIVCSPQELTLLAQHPELNSLVKVIPGIRPAGFGANDQSRVATPGWAMQNGADYLVIGRAITKPDQGTPVDAVQQIIAEIENAT